MGMMTISGFKAPGLSRMCSRLGVSLLLASMLVAAVPYSALAQNVQVHKQAPVFVRNDLTGRRIDLHAYRGRVVLLNFWATWCGPCQVELPRFGAWQMQYGSQGLQVLAVSMDDEATPVRKLVRKLKLDFPVIMGDEKLGNLYGGVLGLPVTYLIGRDGTVAARLEGQADLPAMEERIKGLLNAR
jgi:cytochrome c biogenesis protein CcmG, thiol:disulfide interchange protein DsbE